MWNRICRFWKKMQAQSRLRREVSPDSFRATTEELRDLAALAGRLWPSDHEFQRRIRRIVDEMEQLDQLTSKREFNNLTLEKRMELKESLLESRKQLMETVQSAPPPTDRIQ